MKKILYLLLSLCICACSDFPAKKWVEEAKCVDSIKIVPPNKFALTKDLQIKGLTLQQVEQLYGKRYFAFYENVKISSPTSLEGEDFSDNFSESDFLIEISVYHWIRDTTVLRKIEEKGSIPNAIFDYKGDLGLCLRIYFVKYNNHQIAFEGWQDSCRALLFME